ncbi:MAG: 16S rRNA (cytosine(1402)-N(4))-methyltransferase, partial [Planctomycetaceae bacterium]|nr:16S rRNA (cytosine(1402)-N(4))-methyltransferase [Planctomycetaceae bacterium]
AEWLRRTSEAELVTAFDEWGDVPHARQLAAAIAEQRKRQPIETAEELCTLVDRCSGGRAKGNIRSAAAPVFQAIRIAVNNELNHLQEFLEQGLLRCVAPGVRAAIVSFHSIEDRLVKRALCPDRGWEPIAKKPTEPTPAEARVNPRSRSARLRVAVRATGIAE